MSRPTEKVFDTLLAAPELRVGARLKLFAVDAHPPSVASFFEETRRAHPMAPEATENSCLTIPLPADTTAL